MRALIQVVIVLFCSLNARMGFAQNARVEPTHSQAAESDALALHDLLGETVLSDNAAEVSRHARTLSAEASYDALVQWVLPGDSHPTFRLTGNYYPSSPAPPIKPRSSERPSDSPILSYLGRGETLALPAYELIKVAKLTGKLDQLRDQILAVSPTEVEQKRSQAALLFLVEVARGDKIAAAAAFEIFDRLLRGSERTEPSTRWRDLLVMWSVLPDPDARRIVGDYFFSFYGDLTEYYPDQRFDVIMDYLRATQGLYYFLDSETDQSSVVDAFPDRNLNWIPYSFTSAFSQGHGRPRAIWTIQSRNAQKLAGHVIYPNATGIHPDFTFTPDNRSVLFAKHNPTFQGPQLFLAHRNSPGELELLKGQPVDRKILNCAWSHDGKLIAFTCNLEPERVEWNQQLEQK